MSPEHKETLASGRASGLAVPHYLEALEQNKPRRGRRATAESINRKLEEIEVRLSEANSLQRLHLMQQRKELQAHLASTDGKHVDVEALESEFVTAAQNYGARKGISYATWREAGVSAEVLRRAGIGRGQDQRV